MCYTSPGPRCSSHALSRLKRAKASGDQTAIATAKRDFYLSPVGIKALRNAGHDAQADTAQQLRQELINLSKTHTKLKVKETTPQVETVQVDIEELSDEKRGFIKESYQRHISERLTTAETSSDPERLDILSYDYEGRVLNQVARNTSTPPSTLIRLVDETSLNYGEALAAQAARNPNMPTVVLDRLCLDERDEVREAVADNPNTSSSTLSALATDKCSLVRQGVAQNPNTPPTSLTDLASDIDDAVTFQVAQNLNTPIETLLKMRDSGEPIDERQLPRIAAAVEEYRKKEGLEGIPDSYIEKLLWGDTITK